MNATKWMSTSLATSLVVPVVLLAVVTFGTIVASTTIAQTSAPVSASDDIRGWFKQLSDPSPSVRERARTRLMTMPRSRLNELKRIVSDSRPLTPAQALELRQIVRHVFLSGEAYMSLGGPNNAFIGVLMAPVSVPGSDPNALPERAVTNDPTSNRVMVSQRFPGFSGYPVLRDGDVILTVVGSNRQIYDTRELPTIIGNFQPGDTIELQVQRAGQIITVPVRLSPRPLLTRDGGDTGMNEFLSARDEAAEQYWETNFASLLEQRSM